MKKKHTTAISFSLDIVEGTAFANHSSATSVNAEDKGTELVLSCPSRSYLQSYLHCVEVSYVLWRKMVVRNSKNETLSVMAHTLKEVSNCMAPSFPPSKLQT